MKKLLKNLIVGIFEVVKTLYNIADLTLQNFLKLVNFNKLSRAVAVVAIITILTCNHYGVFKSAVEVVNQEETAQAQQIEEVVEVADNTATEFKIKWNLSNNFAYEVLQVADRLNINPDYLMAVIDFESNIDPQKVNSQSGAVGLIQFMSDTAKTLETTQSLLLQMSGTQQMAYVEKYFEMRIKQYGQLDNLSDVYMAVLAPSAIGKSADTVLYSSGKAYSQNEGLDTNNDHKITKAEATKAVENKMR